MPPDLAPSHRQLPRTWAILPEAWRTPLLLLVLGASTLIALMAREWGQMVHQWWVIDTYSHILLVPPIIAWLVWLKGGELTGSRPQVWAPALGLVAAALALWVAGRASGLDIIAHAGAVGALQAMVVLALGPRLALLFALPIGFAAFLVPFGDEIIPPLQAITAEIAVALTLASGIPAEIDGIYIDTPVGLFIVAEACSGVKFLIAMVTLAVLVCFTRLNAWRRRALFLVTAIVVPIIANGIRAWGTIYVAQFRGVEFAAGFDHIFYGWIFFACVVAFVLAIFWPLFDRDAEDYGWSREEIARFAWMARIEHAGPGLPAALGGFALLVVCAAILAAIVAPAGLG